MIAATLRGTAPARTMMTVTFIPTITIPLTQGDRIIIGRRHHRLTTVAQRSPVGLAYIVEMQYVRIDMMTRYLNNNNNNNIISAMIEGKLFRVDME